MLRVFSTPPNTTCYHSPHEQPQVIVSDQPLTPPQLIFFCELEPALLSALFARPEVVTTLTREGYGVALALPDLSDERVQVIKQLNLHSVPVVAWLLLPTAAGYWFNLKNYPHALAAYEAFRHWTFNHDLQFAGVGLDIEPALSEVQNAHANSSGALFARLWRARRNTLFPAARAAYTDLVVNIRHDGYKVYAYQLPFVVDDRRAGTTVIQRMLDIVDLPVDEEVLMCYSSLLPPSVPHGDLNGAFVYSYGVHADGIAVGSTGGGVILDPLSGAQARRLGWDDLSRDLRIAARFSPVVHVFSLEGCVEQSWLERIATIPWSTPVPVPRPDRVWISLVRSLIAAILFTSRFGLTILGWFGWIVVGWIVLRQGGSAWFRTRRGWRKERNEA